MKIYTYAFLAGPFETKEELCGFWSKGNCRRALQWYFFEYHGIFFSPEQLLCPQSFLATGTFVLKEGEKWNRDPLQVGDVIFAERIRGKDGEKIPSKKNNLSRDEYLVRLHTAIIQNIEPLQFFHATSLSGKSCIWTQEAFFRCYRSIAVKRFV